MAGVNKIKDANLLLGEISVIVDMLQMLTGFEVVRNQSIDNDLGGRVPVHLFNEWPNIYPRKCEPLPPDFTFRNGVEDLQGRVAHLLGQMPPHGQG